MARKLLWKLKLGLLLLVLLIIGSLIAMFPLNVFRWNNVDAYEWKFNIFRENLPVVGRFFPPAKKITAEEQPTYELQVIASQRKELEKKELKYKSDLERLQKVKTDLDNQRRELKKLRDELEVIIGSKEQREADKGSRRGKDAAIRLAQLAKSYEKMDPAAAAKAMAKMEDEDVIDILSKMREKYVSRVIEAMDPDRAAQISAGIIKDAK